VSSERGFQVGVFALTQLCVNSSVCNETRISGLPRGPSFRIRASLFYDDTLLPVSLPLPSLVANLLRRPMRSNFLVGSFRDWLLSRFTQNFSPKSPSLVLVEFHHMIFCGVPFFCLIKRHPSPLRLAALPHPYKAWGKTVFR